MCRRAAGQRLFGRARASARLYKTCVLARCGGTRGRDARALAPRAGACSAGRVGTGEAAGRYQRTGVHLGMVQSVISPRL